MYKYFDNIEEPLKSAKNLLNYIFRILPNPIKSAIDVGCGKGVYLKVLKEQYGINDLVALDGPWYDKNVETITNNIIIHDLNDGYYNNGNKYDICFCLEVAEHVNKEKANDLIKTLTNFSDLIIFSAAIPKQGGYGHVNEQWPSYWKDLFTNYGYDFLDLLRPIIWNNEDIYPWYRQNIFIVSRPYLTNHIIDNYNKEHFDNQMLNIVHPKIYNK